MKILFFALGNELVASSRTRVYQYIPYLKEEGAKCKVLHYYPGWHCKRVANLKKEGLPSRLAAKFYNFLKMLIFLALAPLYDIVFVQRVLLPVPLQKLTLLLNKNIVFDFDDAIFLLNRPCNGKIGRLQNKFLFRLEFMLKSSKCITLENDYTKNYAQRLNKNTLLITGPIDIQRYRPKENARQDERTVLGWIGSPATSFYLKPLYKAFELLADRFKNLTVELIGFSPKEKIEIKGVNVILKDWSLETEVVNLQDFDIGIMPLFGDEWSQGKGGYKLLQYMALGIPSVASPVGINKEIIKDGINGFLADTAEEWIDRISLLISNDTLRRQLGAQARRIAEAFYSYETNTPKLLNALKNLETSRF